MFRLTPLLIGLVFGLGLVLSGMTQPAKVIAFLDVTGQWDPSLAFVMVGAISTHWLLYRFIMKRPSPLLASAYAIPSRQRIDARLLGGSALFGVGWGLGGYCPGPGLASAGALSGQALLFVGAMLAGMGVFELVEARRRAPAAGASQAQPELQRADA
ncbi:MAG: YeeE/YedE family protein [Polyangiaceae bacterium]|nr:YeeE/YedE family protein [Polyangiaceae bacterium]